MSNCAVIQISDNIVVNKIVAEPTDPTSEGTYLIQYDDMPCDIGWIWDGTQFINPNPVIEVLPVTEVTTDAI